MSTPKSPIELADRYLQAVRFWLPEDQQEDIIAELSVDLNSQIDEKENALGRRLAEAEIEELLRRRGRPLLMANRYLPQRYLIGPVLFPIYLLLLKIVGLCYLVPWALGWLGMMFLDSAYRAQPTQTGLVGAVASAGSTLFSIAVVAVGTVTVVFAALEQAQTKSHFLEAWSPGKLPALRDAGQIPRSSSIIDFIVNQAFCIWWATYMSSNVILDRAEVQIVLSPVWQYFFWSFLFLSVANIVLAAVNLVRPYRTVPRAALRLASSAVGSALFCWLLKASILAEVTVRDTSTGRTLEITNAINLWLARSFPVAVIVSVAIVATDARRIFRVKSNRIQLRQRAQCQLFNQAQTFREA